MKSLPMLEMVGDWQAYLAEPEKQNEYDEITANEKSGRPLGNDSFVERLEVLLGRSLKPKKRGRKKKEETA